jgi:outer membrane receptor protein involved in Fe transport
LGTPLTEPNNRNIVSGALGGSFGAVAGGTLQVSAFGQDQRYHSRSSSVNAARTSETPRVAQYIPSHDVGGSVQWSRAAGIFEVISVGGDFRHMVGRLDEDVYDASGAVTGRRTSGGTQQVGGAFIQGVLAPIAPLRVEASARVDAWRSYDGSRVDSSTATPSRVAYPSKRNSAFAPRLGVRYAMSPSVTVRGSVYRAFRAPTLSEEYRTFYSGAIAMMGNPLLTPEYLTGYDAGIDWRPLSVLELRATAFWNEYRDLDEFVQIDATTRQRQNVGRARARGLEAQLALRIAEPLRLAGSYSYDDARVTSTGKFVNRVPLYRGAVRLTYDARAVGTFNVMYRYEGPNHALSGARLAPFEVVDLDARRELRPGAAVFVSAENVFDRVYTVNYSGALEMIGLPRTLRAGVALRSF